MDLLKNFWGGKIGLKELLPNNGEALRHIFSSLRSPNFRLYFGGMCVSLVGTWMQQIAMGWLAYRLTGSVLVLATVTFMQQIPMLFATPIMSVLSDRFNRRTLLLITQTLAMLEAFALAFLVLTDRIEVWHLMALGLCIGLINALDNPTRQVFYPTLVPKEDMSNAIALNASVINGARLIGPAIGGILIAWVGEGFCFLINGISFLAVIGALLKMKLPKFEPTQTKMHLIREMHEGFEYVRGSIPIRTLLLMMCTVSFFGLPFSTFIPAYVKTVLHGDSQLLGLLFSCVGIGSFSAAIYLAARKSVVGLGKVVMLAALILGTSLTLISFTETIWVAALLCIPIGFSLIATVASINTLLQTLSDEDKRGRVMGYLSMTFNGMAPVGALFLGTIEGSIGLTGIMLCSGLCALVAAFVFERYRPLVRKYSRPIFVKKGLIPEIAIGIDDAREIS